MSNVQMKLELIPVPVSDVDRAKAFYVDQAGFSADHDHEVSEEIRFVQLTPPGSACSISIGRGLSPMQPGALQGLQVVVEDIGAARDALAAGGIEVRRSRTSRGAASCSSPTPTATAGRSRRSSARRLRAVRFLSSRARRGSWRRARAFPL